MLGQLSQGNPDYGLSNAPGFVDNVVDQLVLFHQEGGVWKFWGDYEIGVELLKN